jgi:wyosine [tRNA(Phe)-imidazoG37] synthetase (radical SAM superfamily)
VYCQVGLTKKYSVSREAFYEPAIIFKEVENHLISLKESDKPDYLTFVANGEPTLDQKLGKSIVLLQKLNIPIAIITNASLLSIKQVREDLKLADWVSVKIDSGDESAWKAINRPHGKINFNLYIDGLLKFSKEFKGKLVSETMLVKGINDRTQILNKTAELVKQVNPETAYISIPTRPPAVSSVEAASGLTVTEAYQIFFENGLNTELTIGFEGTNTGYTGKAKEDILNICAVHPIREDTMQELLKKDNADFSLVEKLIRENQIQQLEYKSKKFYLRRHLL